MISFYLAYTAFKRGEVRKAVDAIVENIEKCAKLSSDAWKGEGKSEVMFEQEISSFVSRVNIYNRIIEKKCGVLFVEDRHFIDLYDLSSGFSEDEKDIDVASKIHESDIFCGELIYEVEHKYYEYSMSRRWAVALRNFPEKYPDYFGAIIVFTALGFLYLMVHKFV